MFYFVIFIFELIFLYFLSRQTFLVISRLLSSVVKERKWSVAFLAIFFLPGTFVHEAAHFLMALLLFVPVGQFDLMPQFMEDDRVKMGSVPVARTDPLRRLLIGLAPVLAGLTTVFFAVYSIGRGSYIDHPFLRYLLFGYLIFAVGNTMFSSKEDLKGAWVIIVVVVLGYCILRFFGIGFVVDPGNNWIIQSTALIKKTNLFLLVPIGIDVIIVSIFKLVKGG